MLDQKILVLIYGVLGRSLSYNFKNHQNNIFKPLDNFGIDYSISYINNDIENELIDGNCQNLSIVKKLNYDYYTEIKQSFIDKMILEKYSSLIELKKSKDSGFFSNFHCFRNSFIESQCAAFLDNFSDCFDQCLVFCSDLFFGHSIREEYFNKKDHVKIGNQNHACGLTNGFYIGKLKSVSQLLNTFNYIREINPSCYEGILSYNKNKYNINIETLEDKWRWLKIRSDSSPAYFDYVEWGIKGRRPQYYKIKHLLPIYENYIKTHEN